VAPPRLRTLKTSGILGADVAYGALAVVTERADWRDVVLMKLSLARAVFCWLKITEVPSARPDGGETKCLSDVYVWVSGR